MKSFLKIVFVLIYLCSIPNTAQQAGQTKINIKEISVNEVSVDNSLWGSIKISSDATIKFSLDVPEGFEDKMLYKVFLNGKIINPGEPKLNDGITFSQLNIGAYILKVQAYTQSGDEFEPLVLQFQVEERTNITAPDVEQSNISIEDYLNVNTLGGLCFVQFIIILLLFLFREKGGGTNQKSRISELIEELSDYKYSYKRIKEEIENHKIENEYLRKQLKELNKTIQGLEKANVQLLEQKERLTDSKLKLEELQAQKEQLFTMAIHDIKNPASVIRSSLELLNSYDLNASEQHELITSIMNSSDNLVELSQQMCTIIAKSKPEPTLTFTEGSIKEIIDNVCLHNISYAKAKQIQLINKASSSLPSIYVDIVKVEEAIDNLVNNAIKYGPPSTIVEVTSHMKNNKIVVEVKDNGVGLSEDDLKRVFQKGAILSNKPTGVEQSSGLGLWLVKKIIEEHKGQVWVDSKHEKGSTFALELPLHKEEKTQPDPVAKE